MAEGFLDDGEELWQRRESGDATLGRDPRRAAGRVPRLPRLRDDGHAGERPARTRSGRPTSRRPPSAWPRSSARRTPTSLTIYDSDGGYGHPDHIQVHRVGLRAAELAGTPRVLRGHDEPRPHQARRCSRPRPSGAIARRGRARRHRGLRAPSAGPSRSSPPRSTCRTSSTAKRASMAAHASQIAETTSSWRCPTKRFAAGRSATSGSSATACPRTIATTTSSPAST